MTDATRLLYEESAEVVTVTGWSCKTCKRWWADDEHMARWCCASDMACDCGKRPGTEACRGLRSIRAG